MDRSYCFFSVTSVTEKPKPYISTDYTHIQLILTVTIILHLSDSNCCPCKYPLFCSHIAEFTLYFLHFLHSCDRGDSKKSITLGKHARTRAYTHTHTNARATRIHTRTREPRTRTRTNARATHTNTRTHEHTNIRTSKVKLTSKHKKRTNQQRLLTRCSYNQFGSLNKNSPRYQFCNLHISFYTEIYIFLSLFLDFFTLWGHIEVYTNRGHC